MDVAQKLVMAHVYGHVDFFKNNFSFQHTNRKMMDEMANHARRVRSIIARVGIEPVETFIDRALSLENLINQHAPHFPPKPREEAPEEPIEVRGFKTNRKYMSQFINPQGFLDEQRKKLEEERAQKKQFPEKLERDVIVFLIENAPLERWEADILSVVREEAYYFATQAQTKIANEGWASFWHSTIMTQKALKDSEIIDYADHHSGTMGTRPGAINPYKIGIELWRHTEERWNKGRFGKEYDDCDDLRARRAWDKKLGLGREKIFEVRKHYNDITFIDEFLTADFAAEQKLFVYGFNEKGNRSMILHPQFQNVQKKLLQQLTNFGQPLIEVVDGNFENRGEWLLAHRHAGVALRIDHAEDTRVNPQAMWPR